MKQNLGLVDQIMRILIASALAWLSFSDLVTYEVKLVLVIVGVVLLITSLFGFCPLYAILGFRTNKKHQAG